MATNREDKSATQSMEGCTRPLVKADLAYDEEDDFFVCPTGQRLELKRHRESGSRLYQAEAAHCSECPLRNRCCKSKQCQGRSLTCDAREGERRRMVARMDQTKSKQIYDKRKVNVEPVFGQIKNSGIRQFGVRGKVKVAAEFSLSCLTRNSKKLVRAAKNGLIRPDMGNGYL